MSDLNEFSIQYISDEVENVELKDGFNEIDFRKIPKKLYEIYLSASEKNKKIILNSINKYGQKHILKDHHVNRLGVEIR